MKLFLSLCVAVLVLTGCAGTGSQPIQKAVYMAAVSTGVSLGSQRYPEAVPYVRIAHPIICSAAEGTNLSPAQIIALIQSSPAAEAAATPSGKLIVQNVVILYSALFEAGSIENEDARLWLGYTCEAVALGLPPLSSPNAIASRALSPRVVNPLYLR